MTEGKWAGLAQTACFRKYSEIVTTSCTGGVSTGVWR